MIASLGSHLAEVRAARRAPTEDELTESLYQRWFIAWTAPNDLSRQAAGDDRFVAELLALAGNGTWLCPGWTVTARRGAHAFVTDTHVQLYVDAKSELWPQDRAAGRRVHLRMPCARGCATPGFFLLVSRNGRAPDVHDKLYLHLTPAGGRAVIARLRGVNAKFEVKVANAPDAYGRRDSGVVYVEPASRARVVRALLPLTANRALFRAQVPPMTRGLARGLGLAEPDGAGPTSFGEDRCRLVARALRRSRKGGSLAPVLSQVLREAGLDPAAPWKRSTQR